MVNSRKVFVIGLDGATFDLILPWVKERKLPSIAKLMSEGAWGELESTIPPNSAPAWASFATGMNPGRHGIFHFRELGRQSHTKNINNALSFGCKPLWFILSDEDRKVGVINIPFTYPPSHLNGFMVSGLDTPGVNCTFTYPEGLLSEIKQEIGDYRIEAEMSDLYRIRGEEDRVRFIESVLDTERIRADAVKYLMRRYPWDFFMVVFMAIDRMQHRCWKFMDKNHPHYNPSENKFAGAVLTAYKLLDRKVGEIMTLLGADATVIILSDHGCGPSPGKYIDMNKWLTTLNLLHYADRHEISSYFSKEGLKRIGARVFKHLILENLRRYLPIRIRHLLRDGLSQSYDRIKSYTAYSDIDWSRTRAFAEDVIEVVSAIWINLKGRELDGIVEKGREYEELRDNIIRYVKEIRDPDTGERVAKGVYKKEDHYHGPYIDKTPDIIVEWKDDCFRTQLVSGKGKALSNGFIGEITSEESSQTFSGEHRRNGIFIIKGEGILKGVSISGARIFDVAPTILYLLGQSIPARMDGRVITDAFEIGFIRENPVRYTDMKVEKMTDESHRVYSAEEAKKVEERLKGLGYL